MRNEWFPARPRKIVQKFSKAKLEEFRSLPAAAKLAWLEEINLLYWKAAANRRTSHTNL